MIPLVSSHLCSSGLGLTRECLAPSGREPTLALLIRWWLVVTVLVVGVASGAQSPTSVQGQESSVSFGDYTPKKPGTPQELPSEIQRKLNAYLTDRLGKNYLARLRFIGGQVIDFEELYRVNPNARQYKWKIFAYRLGYRISAPEKGIESYVGYVELDRDGNVQKDIEFPAVRRFPAKGDFVTLEAARKRALRAGMSPEAAELRYSREHDSLVFRLTQTISRHSGGRIVRRIDIDAHSGKLLRDVKGPVLY